MKLFCCALWIVVVLYYSSSGRLLDTWNYLVHENSWCNLQMSPLQHLLHSPITSNFASLSGQWFQSLFQANIRPNMPESIWAKQSSLGLMWLKNLLPIFKLLFMLYSKVLYCSLVSFVLSFSMETDFHWKPLCQGWSTWPSVLQC